MPADRGAEFGEQDIAQSGCGPGPIEHGLEVAFGLGDSPEDGAGGDDSRLFQGQEFIERGAYRRTGVG